MNISERFKGSILSGAIGDAYGSAYENVQKEEYKNMSYPFGKPKVEIPEWRITDDTQLTLASCEAIYENEKIDAKSFSEKYLEFFKAKKITGIGASTLKSMQELDFGGRWNLVGRKGEYAAGNGAAMRIAPLAFEKNISRKTIKDICKITHDNDEAYVGALAVVIAIQSVLNGRWTGSENLLKIIIQEIPDTRVRDRLIEIDELDCDLQKIDEFGSDGYVVNSVPLAIAYANKVKEIGLGEMYKKIIDLGGDTDTNCSIAGQIAGALLGINIPNNLMDKLKKLNSYTWIDSTINKFIEHKKW